MRISNKRCFYCQREFGVIPINGKEPLKKTTDHILPISKGGTWHHLNLIDACHKCNSLKADMSLEEFEQFLDKWIKEGLQTRKGYTIENLETMKRKTQKLYHFRSGYIVIMKPYLNKKVSA